MTANQSSPSALSGPPQLKRVLTLRNLILYGMVIVTPAAPMFNFGVISQAGHGQVAAIGLLAMLPMLLTAVSYGRMASAYPSAGSAFTYVAQEISPVTGYVIGWSMVLDYLLCPLLAVIWCSQQAHDLVPNIPYGLWAAAFTATMTYLNLQAVKVSARWHTGLAAVTAVVIAIFFIAAARYVLVHPHATEAFFTRPFYDPHTFSLNSLLAGTSLAVLTYMGFDGVSTLAEEVKNPQRSVLFAMMAAVVITGALSVLEFYAAQLVWPPTEPYPSIDTAFTFVAQRAWAPLFGILGVMLLVASFGSGLATQLAAARLLYGMGRSGALPKRFFGAIDSKRHIPYKNVLCVGAMVLVGAFGLPLIAGKATAFELCANLLNFGALLGFMGVHAAAFVRYFLRQYPRSLLSIFSSFVLPVTGFFACLMLWLNLSSTALLFGGIWMLIGVVLAAWKTRGFKAGAINLQMPLQKVD